MEARALGRAHTEGRGRAVGAPPGGAAGSGRGRGSGSLFGWKITASVAGRVTRRGGTHSPPGTVHVPRGPWSLPRPGPWTAPDREAHAGCTGSRPAPVSSLRELRPHRPLHPGVGCGCGALAWGRPSALLGPHGVSAGQVPVSLHFHCQSLDLLSDQCHGGPFCLRRKAPRYLPSLPSLSLGPQRRAVAALGPRGTTAPEEGTSCGGAGPAP